MQNTRVKTRKMYYYMYSGTNENFVVDTCSGIRLWQFSIKEFQLKVCDAFDLKCDSRISESGTDSKTSKLFSCFFLLFIKCYDLPMSCIAASKKTLRKLC